MFSFAGVAGSAVKTARRPDVRAVRRVPGRRRHGFAAGGWAKGSAERGANPVLLSTDSLSLHLDKRFRGHVSESEAYLRQVFLEV
jgi:hypothetical protein